MVNQIFSGDWSTESLSDDVSPLGVDPLPRYEDGEVWKRVATADVTSSVVDRIFDRADTVHQADSPSMPTASQYLDYYREGELREYNNAYGKQRTNLSSLTLAECIEREGRYVDDVVDYAWTICEQSSWVLPAHHSRPELPESRSEPTIDLNSSLTALLLAELEHLFATHLPDSLENRIQKEVDRRVLTPYEENEYWWMDATSNWNAVCTAGAVGAALYLVEDTARVSSFIARAAESTERYLDGFGRDGCTHEGIGYWNYGFGYFVILADLISGRTGGTRSIISPSIVRKVATYPLAVELSPTRYLPFSDASESDGILPFAACWLGQRLELPSLGARGRYELTTAQPVQSLPRMRRNLFWCLNSPEKSMTPPPKRSYFSDDEWWIVRTDHHDPETFVVAAKGGHNAESHNHLDCGSFVTHFRGESLLTDLGKPVYDRDYFGEDRYEYLVTRSLGHSVPFINGFEQGVGEEYSAQVVEQSSGRDIDTFVVELGACYPDEAHLSSLRRQFTVTHSSTHGSLELTDTVAFDSTTSGAEYESILVSYSPMEMTDEAFWVIGEQSSLQINVQQNDVSITVEHLPDAVNRDIWRMHGDWYEAEGHPSDVWRARIRHDAGTHGQEDDPFQLHLTITPDVSWRRYGHRWHSAL